MIMASAAFLSEKWEHWALLSAKMGLSQMYCINLNFINIDQCLKKKSFKENIEETAGVIYVKFPEKAVKDDISVCLGREKTYSDIQDSLTAQR